MPVIDNSTIHFIENVLYMTLEGSIDKSTLIKKVAIRREFANNENILLLSDITKMRDVTKDAKKYIASPEATKDIIANAILINSYTTMMIGNLYLFFEKPAVPARLFTKKNKALDWLKQFDPAKDTFESNYEHNIKIIEEINSDEE